MNDAMLEWGARRGYRAGWGPARLLATVQEELEERERNGQIDAAFALEHLSFGFDDPPLDWRVLVVIVPRPAHLVRFTVNRIRLDAVLPPTYQRSERSPHFL